MNSVLGKLSKEDFLANYWQQKPLVIRNAFPDFEMPFDAGELAGLAIDTDAPARIIVEKGLSPDFKPWTAKHSPFSDEDFTSLPDTHWTFLVNDLERYVPELGNLIEPFRFIPDWRIDDLMVSYAADQGSVGPHTDEYDVFLIQGEGKRRWQVITRENYPKDLLTGSSLAILKNFEADEEWLLEKGDMLYLPPNIPHYGIAEGECFTFSVGFRTPESTDLIQNWFDTSFADSKRFSDIGRKLQASSGEIHKQDIDKLTDLILSTIQHKQGGLSLFLGKYLTESKGHIPNREDIHASPSFNPKIDYERETWLRFAYILDEEKLHFFADGKHIELTLDKMKDIQELCENFYYSSGTLDSLAKDKSFKTLFTVLIREGGLVPAE